MQFRLALVAIAAIAAIACLTLASGTQFELPKSFFDEWENHKNLVIQTYSSEKFMEPKCIPRFYPAKNQSNVIGTIVIWDGFTTCWQQSENLAEVLNNEGYNIIQPNHLGVASNDALLTLTNAQEYWALPDSALAYSEQIAQINRVIAQIPRENHQVIVIGTSLGGAMALKQAAAFPFDKVVAMAPLLKVNRKADKNIRLRIARFAAKVWPKIMDISHSWGKICDEERAIFDRPGPCKFQMKHFEAVRSLGLSTRTIYRSLIPPENAGKYLIIGVDGDPVVETPTIRHFAARHGLRYWELPEGVSHSVLSVYASTKSRPWWNCEVTLRIIDFLQGREVLGHLRSTEVNPVLDAKCIWPYEYPEPSNQIEF